MKRRFLPLLACLALGLALTASPAAASTPQATVTMVFQVNVTVPVINKAALGTFTMTFDTVTERGTWSFQGTIDGQFATASGTGICRVASAVRGIPLAGSLMMLPLARIADTPEITASIDRIDTWQMPGINRPSLPADATLRTVGNLTYVSYRTTANAPLAVSPPIAVPFQSGTYTVTSPGTGAQPVPNLPNTGTDPAGMTSRAGLPTALFAGGLFALLAASGTLAYRRRLRRGADPAPAAN